MLPALVNQHVRSVSKSTEPEGAVAVISPVYTGILGVFQASSTT
jgi:hypothetical protein